MTCQYSLLMIIDHMSFIGAALFVRMHSSTQQRSIRVKQQTMVPEKVHFGPFKSKESNLLGNEQNAKYVVKFLLSCGVVFNHP